MKLLLTLLLLLISTVALGQTLESGSGHSWYAIDVAVGALAAFVISLVYPLFSTLAERTRAFLFNRMSLWVLKPKVSLGKSLLENEELLSAVDIYRRKVEEEKANG